MGGGCRAYAPRAVLASLLGRPWLCTFLGVVVGIVVSAVERVLVARGGAASSSASSVVDATLTHVHRAAFVACVRIAAEAAAARPDGRRHRISSSPVHQAAIVARASLTANGCSRASALSAAWALSATFPPGGPNNANTPILRLPGPTWPLLIHREHGDPGPQQPLLRGVPWVVCRRLPWSTLMPFAFALARS